MDDTPLFRPAVLAAILTDARRLDFALSCEERTGSPLATLAASKPGGGLLELGTGVGAGAAWIAAGMDATAALVTVEHDLTVRQIARRHLGETHARPSSPRTPAPGSPAGRTARGTTWRTSIAGGHIRASARPAVAARPRWPLRRGRPDAPVHWPDDHPQRVNGFLARLPDQRSPRATPMRWSSALAVGART